VRRLALALLLLAAACRREPVIEEAGGPPPLPVATHAVGPACVHGWGEPDPGPVREAPLELLRRAQGWQGSFRVDEMRWFTGADGTWYWYAKVVLVAREPAKLRFLATRPAGGGGGGSDEGGGALLGVAPFATTGFRAADWTRVDGTGPPTTVPGVPGRWTVAGDLAGALPADVRGCLAG
jgi:hypothetical protein